VRLSAEARILRSPSTAFRQLLQEPRSGPWVRWQRPLLLAFVLGCVVSIQASGALTTRLIVDGAISFAFIPLFEMLSLAIAFRAGHRPIAFARAADLFFAANAPWLAWLMAFCVLRVSVSPLYATAPPVWLLWTVELSVIPVALWSAHIDLHFFRTVLERTKTDALRGLILQRVLGWTASVVYFFGIALWPHVVSILSS
jgi:hypothetical protein